MVKSTRVLLLQCVIFIFIHSCSFAQNDLNRFIFRTSYNTDDSFEYSSLYLMYRLYVVPAENVESGVTLVKGRGESGYYPQGYAGESDAGLYENGSYYVMVRDVSVFDKLIIGNYNPLFGQGLLFGGSFPLLVYNPYYDLARFRNSINPSQSTSKASLLEGISAEMEFGSVKLRPFISWNRFDCTAGESDYYKYNDNDGDGVPNDEDEDDFTGVRNEFPDGYSCKNNVLACIRDDADYGLQSDRDRRNNLAEYVTGLNVYTAGRYLRVGGTVHYTAFNRLIDPYYDFDPLSGDKTAEQYRGKDYFASSVYFKAYEPIEVFGELGGTFYRRLSFYEEFDGDFISALALSGGVRKKLDRTGIVAWGAYIPATFVNPHGLELPDGINNLAAGLIGVDHHSGSRRFIHWVYGYTELYSPDGPDTEERGYSYNHRIELSPAPRFTLKIRQNIEFVNHHYYAPDALSLKGTNKLTLEQDVSQVLDARFIIENRVGGPLNRGSVLDSLQVGTGISGELLISQEPYSAALLLTYYLTGDDRFAYLYPYERPLYDWNFVSQSLHGHGFAGSIQYVRHLAGGSVIGAKLRYQLDFMESDDRGISVLLTTQLPF
jgi:hypothetical protein